MKENLIERYLRENGYEGEIPEVLLTDEAHSFSVDSKDKEHFVPALVIGGTALIYKYAPEITEAAVKYVPMLLSIMLDPPKINKEREDEIDNLGDIKNYKSIIISDNKNAESEKENKDEQITNVESVSASSPSPLPDPNNKDDKEMEELKKKQGKGSFKNTENSVEYHFNEHGEEVGASDLRQYLRKAKEFARNLKRARKVGRVKGRTPGVIRYEKNGRYIDLAPNGDIISFGEFKPLK